MLSLEEKMYLMVEVWAVVLVFLLIMVIILTQDVARFFISNIIFIHDMFHRLWRDIKKWKDRDTSYRDTSYRDLQKLGYIVYTGRGIYTMAQINKHDERAGRCDQTT